MNIKRFTAILFLSTFVALIEAIVQAYTGYVEVTWVKFFYAILGATLWVGVDLVYKWLNPLKLHKIEVTQKELYTFLLGEWHDNPEAPVYRTALKIFALYGYNLPVNEQNRRKVRNAHLWHILEQCPRNFCLMYFLHPEPLSLSNFLDGLGQLVPSNISLSIWR